MTDRIIKDIKDINTDTIFYKKDSIQGFHCYETKEIKYNRPDKTNDYLKKHIKKSTEDVLGILKYLYENNIPFNNDIFYDNYLKYNYDETLFRYFIKNDYGFIKESYGIYSPGYSYGSMFLFQCLKDDDIVNFEHLCCCGAKKIDIIELINEMYEKDEIRKTQYIEIYNKYQ